MFALLPAFAPREARLLRHLCPRSCWQLGEVVVSDGNSPEYWERFIHDIATAGGAAVAAAILPMCCFPHWRCDH